MTKRTIGVIAAFLFFTVGVKAQMAEPVKWSFKFEKIANSESDYEITLIADIQEGWYVYSQEISGRGPIPTKINFEQNPNLQLQGKPMEIGDKKEIFDQNFNINVTKLSGTTQFIQKAIVKGGLPVVKGQLLYMTCNGQICLPPKRINFDVVLNK